MTVEYPQRFKKLLDSFKGSSPDNYIGQGNPGADVLIIGKETTTTDEPFLTIETWQNFETWQKNYGKRDFADVYDWETTDLPFEEKYNPLFPYNSWRIGKSKTWDGYQAIINHIYPQEQAHKGELYNFWRYCFVTELSTNNMKVSSKNKETAKSIQTRLNGIFQQDFFQQFPIIILACYHYKDWYKIDIEKCFNQKFVGTPFDENHEFIHEHRNGKRLLLHTNHAVSKGMGLHTEKYYATIGQICRDFLDGLK